MVGDYDQSKKTKTTTPQQTAALVSKQSSQLTQSESMWLKCPSWATWLHTLEAKIVKCSWWTHQHHFVVLLNLPLPFISEEKKYIYEKKHILNSLKSKIMYTLLSYTSHCLFTLHGLTTCVNLWLSFLKSFPFCLAPVKVFHLFYAQQEYWKTNIISDHASW